MNREVHVRNCEGVGVKLPRATRLTLREVGLEAVRSIDLLAALLRWWFEVGVINHHLSLQNLDFQ